jgi:hypothetical protein
MCHRRTNRVVKITCVQNIVKNIIFDISTILVSATYSIIVSHICTTMYRESVTEPLFMLIYSIYPILIYFCPNHVRIAYTVKKVSAESLAGNVKDI